MIRRRFIQLMTLAGVGTLETVSAVAKNSQAVVTYKITGFTCITCAVGLDTMLERKKGVVWSKSSYADAKTSVCYQPDLASETGLQAAIAEMGFRAEKLG